MNLTGTIIPKSDQLNADDLISGPRTIQITAVESGSAEQPVSIQYVGGKGRPYKPSKSMRRVLVAIWGTDGEAYVGRSISIYRDPNIRFGGEPVGGICISHATDIEEEICIALTVTRGKRKPFSVRPLVIAPLVIAPPSAIQSLTDVSATEPKPASGEKPHRPMDELVAAGDSIAPSGSAALQKWWTESLTKAERQLLKEKIGQWKQLAEEKAAA